MKNFALISAIKLFGFNTVQFLLQINVKLYFLHRSKTPNNFGQHSLKAVFRDKKPFRTRFIGFILSRRASVWVCINWIFLLKTLDIDLFQDFSQLGKLLLLWNRRFSPFEPTPNNVSINQIIIYNFVTWISFLSHNNGWFITPFINNKNCIDSLLS